MRALINGGYLIPPTFLPRSQEEADALAKQVVKPETGDSAALSLPAQRREGSGKTAEVPGYRVGGKTGTAEKVDRRPLFDEQAPQRVPRGLPDGRPAILVLVVLDEPKPEKPGAGATAGSTAAPTVAAIIRRVGADARRQAAELGPENACHRWCRN